MTTDIFIVTFRRDFEYLRWCLKSIEKFATGFHQLMLLVPDDDYDDADSLTRQYPIQFPYDVCGFAEWKGKGMLSHMHQIVCADQWSEADFIAHLDSDCIFTAPVTPETFIKDGKPILQYERLESITKRHSGVGLWGEVTQRCLPFPIHFETMRGHPEVYHRGLYAETRKLMEVKTGMPCDEYIKAQKNDYPNGFCEFVTLGNVAIHCFYDKYHLIDNSLKPNPDKSDFPVFQAWSHAPPDVPQDLWHEGIQQRIVPLEMFKKVLQIT